ncbi:class I SAM-dependent RNA methyltransferase [candidate division KSB1 bacterium]|nr:class I SAM-dependent RNA methyltransferase [candidate division KSB1 bacterium]
MFKIFISCAPGLESLVITELNQLGLLPENFSGAPVEETTENEPQLTVGGIELIGALRDLYRLNLHLRTASSVLVRLGEFYAAAFSELRRKTSNLPWELFLTAEQPVNVRVTCHKSRLYHSDAVAERISGAIADRLREASHRPMNAALPESRHIQLVVVRVVKNFFTISVDSSGTPLHRRGYRLATGKAPLRENIAAALILATGWSPESPLLDPFCGSGTIPIEAAMFARHIPPGQDRHFSFMDWASWDVDLWKSLLVESQMRQNATASPIILASDRDAGAIQFARDNAQRAGVADDIDFSARPISAIEPPAIPGWIVTNPPYGQRLSPLKDLRNLYAQLGKVLRLKCDGWQIALLCNNEPLLLQTGLQFKSSLSLRNGGLPVKFVQGTVQ